MNLVPIYSCLADETRLRMVHLLARTPLCVCHLQNLLDLAQVAASKHLAYLRRCGLVVGRRHQQWMIYSLPTKPSRELALQVRALQECARLDPVLRDDLRRLAEIEPDCCWAGQALEGPGRAKHSPRLKAKRTPLITT